MLISLLGVLFSAAPTLLVLLVGLGAAVWVSLRARSAGIALGVGVIVLAVAELVSVGAALVPQFVPSPEGAMVTNLVFRAVYALMACAGVATVVVAASMGREIDEEAA
ncbi:MAG: hypothetical protein R3F59_03270 [Myxococcota bacterium]